MTELHTLRQDLAAAFRWAARMGMHESIANHFSVATDASGSRFLLNPVGAHFSRMRASDLMLIDLAHPENLQGDDAPDPTAWTLHAALHQRLPQARCILHTHMLHATTLCCLKDFEFLMLDQNACRFHQRIAYDRDYAGMALHPDEGARVAGLMGADKQVLFMGNHGVIVVGATVAEAFDRLYYLEKACALQCAALATGRPLAPIPEAVAAEACRQWNDYPTPFSNLHFVALKTILNQEEPDYAL